MYVNYALFRYFLLIYLHTNLYTDIWICVQFDFYYIPDETDTFVISEIYHCFCQRISLPKLYHNSVDYSVYGVMV